MNRCDDRPSDSLTPFPTFQDFFNSEVEEIEEGDAVVAASSYSPDSFVHPLPLPLPLMEPTPPAQGAAGSSNHGSSQNSYSRNRSNLAPKPPGHSHGHGGSDLGEASHSFLGDRDRDRDDHLVVEGKKSASFTLPKGVRGLLATPTSPMARGSACDSYSKQVSTGSFTLSLSW